MASVQQQQAAASISNSTTTTTTTTSRRAIACKCDTSPGTDGGDSVSDLGGGPHPRTFVAIVFDNTGMPYYTCATYTCTYWTVHMS